MPMTAPRDPGRGLLIAAALGMIIGGLLTITATNAIPKMMSRMMCDMMNNMAARMGTDSLSPEEM
jgi:hypothetical protein